MLKRHCIIISLLFLALCELYLLWSLWASLNVNVPVLWTRLVCYWVNAMSQFLFSFPLSETASTSIESPDSSCHVTIPLGYQNFCEVFSKMKVFGLLPHWPYDWSTDLIPGTMTPHSHIYPLSVIESQAMQDYITLAQGYIHPSTSPASASFFFVEKKGSGLRPWLLRAKPNHYQISLPITFSPIGPQTAQRSLNLHEIRQVQYL